MWEKRELRWVKSYLVPVCVGEEGIKVVQELPCPFMCVRIGS